MRTEKTYTEVWVDNLDGYGNIGGGVASSYILKRTTRVIDDKEPIVSYSLVVTSKNKYDISYYNRYGFPTAAKEDRYDEGTGFAGFMSQAPVTLLTLINENTGVNLLELK